MKNKIKDILATVIAYIIVSIIITIIFILLIDLGLLIINKFIYPFFNWNPLLAFIIISIVPSFILIKKSVIDELR